MVLHFKGFLIKNKYCFEIKNIFFSIYNKFIVIYNFLINFINFWYNFSKKINFIVGKISSMTVYNFFHLSGNRTEYPSKQSNLRHPLKLSTAPNIWILKNQWIHLKRKKYRWLFIGQYFFFTNLLTFENYYYTE